MPTHRKLIPRRQTVRWWRLCEGFLTPEGMYTGISINSSVAICCVCDRLMSSEQFY